MQHGPYNSQRKLQNEHNGQRTTRDIHVDSDFSAPPIVATSSVMSMSACLRHSARQTRHHCEAGRPTMGETSLAGWLSAHVSSTWAWMGPVCVYFSSSRAGPVIAAKLRFVCFPGFQVRRRGHRVAAGTSAAVCHLHGFARTASHHCARMRRRNERVRAVLNLCDFQHQFH
jgi:hypothetical protein